MTVHLFPPHAPWWAALQRYLAAPEERADAERAEFLRRLVHDGHADAACAAADAALYGAAPGWAAGRPAPGVARALEHDVRVVQAALSRLEGCERAARRVPPLAELALPPAEPVRTLAAAFSGADPATVVERILRHRRECGGGPLGRHRAFRWEAGGLRGVARPTGASWARLAGLDEALAGLARNTEAFLHGEGAQHVLLYGPRGSGKSTAVRGLLPRYAEAGLRLVEVPPGGLAELPTLLERIERRPERFVAFVDDLAFGADDGGYRPLKSLLEGSLEAPPANVRVYATSNRRHLVPERRAERPDPLEDEVHAWDAHEERLALADRFGLRLTFPGADQRAYLAMVRHLAKRDGLAAPDLEARALRFAAHGNGRSGRTAQRFVEAVAAGLA